MPTTITGTDGVSQVQDGAVTATDLTSTLDLSGKAVTLPAGVGGKVLQVVQGSELTTQTEITSSSYTDVGISVSINPSSTSSKIMLLASFNINNRRFTGSSPASSKIQIADANNNNIYVPSLDSQLSYYFQVPSSGDLDFWRSNTISYLDSPNASSLITYKLRAAKSGGLTLRFRGGHIIAMEIAG